MAAERVLVLLICLHLTQAALTDAQKKQLLDDHNAHRNLLDGEDRDGQTYSGFFRDMKVLRWDEDLAANAQLYAEECIWDHGTVEDGAYWATILRSKTIGIGQNLFLGGEGGDPTAATGAWHREVRFFSWAALDCDAPEGATCGHFQQLMLSSIELMGCGAHSCPGVGNIVACHYNRVRLPASTFEKSPSKPSCPVDYQYHCEYTNLCTSVYCDLPLDACEDQLDGQLCFNYASKDYCLADDRQFHNMLSDCPHTCGLCEADSAPECVDTEDAFTCDWFGDQGFFDKSSGSFNAMAYYQACPETSGACTEILQGYLARSTRITDEFGINGGLGAYKNSGNGGILTGEQVCPCGPDTSTSSAAVPATTATPTHAATSGTHVVTSATDAVTTTGSSGVTTTSAPIARTSTTPTDASTTSTTDSTIAAATPTIGPVVSTTVAQETTSLVDSNSDRGSARKSKLPIWLLIGGLGGSVLILLVITSVSAATVFVCIRKQNPRSVTPEPNLLRSEERPPDSPPTGRESPGSEKAWMEEEERKSPPVNPGLSATQFSMSNYRRARLHVGFRAAGIDPANFPYVPPRNNLNLIH